MAYNPADVDRWANVGVLGVGRRFTVGAVAENNATALTANGAYLLTVETGAVRMVGPAAETTSANGDSTLLMAGNSIRFVCGSVAAEQFVSLIRDTADSVVTVCGNDQYTALTQPPDWS